MNSSILCAKGDISKSNLVSHSTWKALELNEITNKSVNKSKWSQHFVVAKKKKPPIFSAQMMVDDEMFLKI